MPPRDEDSIAVPREFARMRRYALDAALLLFDRRTGWTAICDGEETAHLRMRVPRVVQFSITNACNLACTFCSRPLDAGSHWEVDTAYELLSELDRAGTLEVAFGGGEPLAFRGFPELVRRLHEQTGLAVSMTTNGLLLNAARCDELLPYLGQLRVSVYDDNRVDERIALLAERRASFGLNYLVTPARLDGVEMRVLDWVARGARDVLMLSYNGRDERLHLDSHQASELGERVAMLERAVRGRATVKLDVCWGERLDAAPRLVASLGCAAGREFVVVTSDRRVAPCSFHHHSVPFRDASHLLRILRRDRDAFAGAARDPGCARTPGFGLPIARGDRDAAAS